MQNNINASKQVNELTKAYSSLTKEVSHAVDVFKEYQKTNQKLPSEYLNSLKQLKDVQEQYNKAIATANGKLKEYSATKKEEARLNNAVLNSKAKLALSTSKEAKELAKLRLETQQQNRANKEAAILSSKLAGEYQKLALKLKLVSTRIQDLNAKRLQGKKLTDKEQAELKQSIVLYGKYDRAIRGADASVGKFQRNVGNYPKAMGAAANAVRSLASAMGLVGGAFLFVQVMRDAFNRVREFDKAMQNISGVLRTSRKDIADLEKVIISVAGASVKTSREVANLAESLVTLGKTKSEIKDLLSPVNDLAIGLETTGAEAAEFLVQTLNAFGASSSEAREYADTIAAIRTSTSLDFQKMRDSFQYITPISKILNKDLAYTGAVVGVLADNGLKAESAGRLLATAQIKLATTGKSLQQGLDEINEAYKEGKTGTELLTIANELFGKQAAKIGVILATQQKRLGEYEDKIRSSGGALDDLVNEQLVSLDAKLKILDSTWEKFILSIENGNGIIAKTIKVFADLTIGALNLLNTLNALTSFDYNNATIDKYYNDTLKVLDIDKQSKEVLEASLVLNRKKLSQLKTIVKFNDLTKEQLKNNQDEQLQQLGIIKALKERIAQTKNETGAVGENTDAINKNTDARKKGLLIREGSLRNFKNIISALENEQSRLAVNSKEWVTYQKQIDKVKKSMDDFLFSISNNTVEGITEGIKEINNLDIDPIELPEILLPMDEDRLEYYKKNFVFSDDEMSLIGEQFDYLGQLYGVDGDKFTALFDRKENTVKDYVAASAEASKALYNSFSHDYEADLERVRSSYDRALVFAGENTEAQAQLREQLKEKEDEIRKKKFEQEKEAALFNIFVNTATAVVQALPNIPLSVIVGGIGLAQAAAVQSRELPAFKDGVRDFSGGLAIVGDGGKHEYIKTPDGKVSKTPKTDTLVNLPKGSDVFKNETDFNNELNNMLNFNGIFREKNNVPKIVVENSGLSKEDYKNGVNQIIKTISNQNGYEIIYSENGIEKYIKKGHAKTKVLNDVLRIKGRNV